MITLVCLFREKELIKLLEMIDKTFSLRECTDKEFSKKKKCFLADIERCTAPCVKKTTLIMRMN